MKILCVSDAIDPYVFSIHIKERFTVDAVLCAGDLPLEYVEFLSSALGKPVFFVSGNHHGFAGDCAGGVYAGFRCLEADIRGTKVLIAGASGAPGPRGDPGGRADRAMKARLLALYPRLLWNKLRRGRYLDVFLTYAPPRGINDRDDMAGFPCFRSFIERFAPAFHIHGFVHLFDPRAPRRTIHGKTTVVNAGGFQVIEIPG
ncbi:MAG: metallophosphoesterase [Spirochaetaceae bacterium]|nr:metallophosphoesterase [Spirochaetaceae bacterium]